MPRQEPPYSLLSGEAKDLMDGDIRASTKTVYKARQEIFQGLETQ